MQRARNRNVGRLTNGVGVSFCVICLAVFAGCPGTGIDSTVDGLDPDDATTDIGGVSGEIINFTTNFSLSELDPAVTVLYSVTGTPDSIVGFYVQVADSSPGAGEIGERVEVAANLPSTGPNTRFEFNPAAVGIGFYRVGIRIRVDDEVEEVASDGIIQIEGPPNPVFVRPTDTVTEVLQGTDVPVAFDAGDPENDVAWRLFYLSESDSRTNLENDLGTLLRVGTGNVGSATLVTDSLNPGEYQLGLSATDSGRSIAGTVTDGNLDRIVTIFGPVVRVIGASDIAPPTLVFTAPGMADVELFRNEAYDLEFSATVSETGATAAIELFYDDDKSITNGFRGTLVDSLPSTTTSFPLPTAELPGGTWYIGGTIRTIGGIGGAVTSYASGRITVVRDPTLTVTEPDSPLPVAPSGDVTIAWTTNVPPSAGTVSVFVKTIATSAVAALLSSEPLTTTSATFTSDTSGLFEITVELDLIDGTTLSETAPSMIRVSSLPRIAWLGSLATNNPDFDGAIFGGVNFEDNAGSSFTTVADLNTDGLDEFVIAARYGKPFFANPTGIGVGEAYLIHGRSGANRLVGEFSLNSVGSSTLPGVIFTGIRTPQASNDTDGMSSVVRIPDVDGDGKDEIVFGFPDTDSRGHNVSSLQDGVIDPQALATLEREDQFLRGGVVIVSSQNSVLTDPTLGEPVINLDLVGQSFDVMCVEEEIDPAPDAGDFFVNIHSEPPDTPGDPGCEGTCDDPSSGGLPDATEFIKYGFVAALARDYFYTYVYSFEFYGGSLLCTSPTDFVNHECIEDMPVPVLHDYCAPFTAGCEPHSPGLHSKGGIVEYDSIGLPIYSRHSGYYPRQWEPFADGDPVVNQPGEPFGARIIGVGLGDRFGTSLTLSSGSGLGAGDIIVSSPGRTARGILLGPDGGPENGGEIDGMGTQSNADSGVAYIFALRSLWTASGGRIPPKPHQYIVGEASHCAGPDGLIANLDAIRIAGLTSDQITNILGIADFNGDGRNDFAIGAPDAGGGQGRVYVAYRRQAGVEGDYVLDKLALAQNDPERLEGMLVVTQTLDGLGASLAADMDFNGDGVSDLVIGSPTASGGVGEVVIIFGNSGIVSPTSGITVDTLLTASRTAAGQPVAARILGNSRDASGSFGFNIANAGDVDGDGIDDLLIAAPGASPRFDPTPSDADDTLSEPGLDLDFDGIQDDVTGPTGQPDGQLTEEDSLSDAGIVYVLSSRNRFDRFKTCSNSGRACVTSSDCESAEETCSSADMTISIDQLGTSQLRGFMIVGRHAGDQIGGGDAGDSSAGGIEGKRGRGRSRGLATAGDVDGDNRADILIGSVFADPRIDPNTGLGVQNGGEAYLIYGSVAPE